MNTTTVAATADNFHDLVHHSDQPVLVDFWADWCHPCHMLAPVLDKVAAEYADRLTVVKVDVDAYPELADEYQVQGFPTLKLFANGAETDTLMGAVPKRALTDWLDTHL